MIYMAVVQWRLASFLEARQITAYALAKASGVSRMTTIYRIAKVGEEPTRVDLPTLAAVIVGLRKLTGEDVQITDVLEFVENENSEP